MLIGEYQHSLDNKGRVTVPVKFREDLGEHFVVTKGFDQCLYVYSMEEWERFSDKLKKLPLSNPDAREIVRFFTARACDCELDKQGRVLIQNGLREYGDLVKDVVFVGTITRAEIWDRAKYEEKMSVAADPDEMSARLEAKMAEFDL